MKINIICQYYLPEIGAPQARLSEMAREWMAKGHDITILTAFPNHPTGVIPFEYRGKVFMEEFVDGIRVWRHWIYATPNEGFFKKTCAHISFMASLIGLSLFRGKQPDVYIVSSPNFFSVISTYLFSRIRRVSYIFEVRDLWPGIFIDLGVLKNRRLIRILEKIELFLYRKAAVVVPVTHGFAKDIIRRGIPSHKIKVITNGVDLDTYRPSSENVRSRLKTEFSQDDFVVAYIGAHGISHGLSKVLDAAEALQDEKGVRFLFVGEGAEKTNLVESARKKKLKNVTFLPSKKREEVIDFYHLADTCLVPLKNVAGFDTFIPSKMFEIMGCGKSIIASLRGEAADILTEAGAAVIVRPEDPKELGAAIRSLKDDPEKRRIMGERGRRFVEKHFNRKALAEKYLDLIEEVVGRKNEAR
jgi:glycosyltransferase involved in cell wall biosynthesis